ncbi:hypothetical protein GQ42DRAFT_176318 [Ramicandelaber brevisporus]|nr:hypothetical protein GQ42DRAFT_176318 [Ramicandelaber brevisporus]
MLHDSIIRLFIDAVKPGMLEDMNHGDDDKLFFVFYRKMSTLSRNLVDGENLTDKERIMAARIGSIVYSLYPHLATLVDIEVWNGDHMASLFAHVVHSAFFTTFLAFEVYGELSLQHLLSGLRLSQNDFKRLLTVIETETYRRVVPRDVTHCTAYTDVIESMILAENRGICTYEAHDENGSMMHGYWIEAEYKGGSKLVFRNLKCPGGDECPISCDQVQRVLRYKGDKSSGMKSKKKKAKKAVKHKPFKPQAGESDQDDTTNTKSTTSDNNIEQEEEGNEDDADDLSDSSESDDHDFQEYGLMIPKDFIQSSVSRGMFGFKRLPLMLFWHLSVIGITMFMFLLAFGVINTNSSNGSAAANSADSNGSGNNTTTAGNIVSSGNVTNFIMRGATYLASNASAIIAVISALGIPGAFIALTWIRESWYPATTYFELLAAKAAVTSFKKACKLKGVCPGCLMAAVLRNRAALMLLAFGQFAGLVARPNTAFLVRETPDWPGVAMIGYVTVLNNKVGRLTYFKEPILVKPLSTPMINFQYLM